MGQDKERLQNISDAFKSETGTSGVSKVYGRLKGLLGGESESSEDAMAAALKRRQQNLADQKSDY